MNKMHFGSLFLCNLIASVVGNGLFPLLPGYAKILGASAELTGYYLSFTFFALVVGNVAGGWLSDRIDRRKVLLAGAGALCISPIYFMGIVTDIWQLVVLTTAAWFLFGVMLVEISTLTGLFTREIQRGKVFGSLTSAGGLGSLLGGLITGPIVDRWGFPILFVVLAALIALAPLAALIALAPLVALAARDRRLVDAQSGDAPMTNDAVRLPALFLVFLVANAAAFVANSGSGLARLLGMNALGFGAAAISATVTVSGMVVIVFPLIIGPLSDRLGRKWPLAFCYLSTAASLLIMGIATDLWQFYLSSALQAVNASSRAVGRALAADLVPPKALGRGMSLFEASPWFGGIFGNTGMGSAVQHLGLTTAVVVIALLPLLAIVLLIPVRRVRPEQEERVGAYPA